MAGPRKVQSKPIIVDAYRMPTPDEIVLAGLNWENLTNEAANWITEKGGVYETFDIRTGELFFYTTTGPVRVLLGDWIIFVGKRNFETMTDDSFWNRYRDLPSATHNPKPLPVPPVVPEPEVVIVNDGFVNPMIAWASGAPRYKNDIDRLFEAMQVPLPNDDVAEKDMEESYRAIAKWITNLQGSVEFDRSGNFEILMPGTDIITAGPSNWIIRDFSGDFFVRTDRVFRDEYKKAD